MLDRLRALITAVMAPLVSGDGRKDRASEPGLVEFKDVFDQVLQEGNWTFLRAGALERSWNARNGQKKELR
jgi:hypothetical protein